MDKWGVALPLALHSLPCAGCADAFMCTLNIQSEYLVPLYTSVCSSSLILFRCLGHPSVCACVLATEWGGDGGHRHPECCEWPDTAYGWCHRHHGGAAARWVPQMFALLWWVGLMGLGGSVRLAQYRAGRAPGLHVAIQPFVPTLFIGEKVSMVCKLAAACWSSTEAHTCTEPTRLCLAVRFGKYTPMRSKDKKVQIFVNGEQQPCTAWRGMVKLQLLFDLLWG